MGLALAAVGLGVLLVVLGGTRVWATVTASAELAGFGRGQVARVGVPGDELGSFSALAWFTLLVGLGVLVTAGRGRWAVGVMLAGMAAALAWLAVGTAGRSSEHVFELVASGRLDGLPAGALLTVTRSPAGPALVCAGAALVLAAGVVTVARGRGWPSMGQAFRAPADRVTTTPEAADPDAEPPWEGG
jgi:hypothetical protein